MTKREYFNRLMLEPVWWLQGNAERPSVGMTRVHVLLSRLAVRRKLFPQIRKNAGELSGQTDEGRRYFLPTRST